MVSNIALWAFTKRQVDTLSERIQLGEYRVTTGNRFRELKDHGISGVRLVDLRAALKDRTTFEKAILHAQTNIDAYTNHLDQLYNLSRDLIRVASENPPSNYDANWARTNRSLADSFLLSIGEVLSAQFSGRYLFGGQRWEDPPVSDLRELINFGADDANDRRPNGVTVRLDSMVETGDRTGFENQLPQIEYQAQNLAINRVVPNIYVQSGDQFSEVLDPESLTTGSGETIDYRVTLPGGASLPQWMNYDAAQRRISGQPPTGFAGTITLQVEARNDLDEVITDTFDVVVGAGPNPPLQVGTVEGVAYRPGETFTIPAIDDLFSGNVNVVATVAAQTSTGDPVAGVVVNPDGSITGQLPPGTTGNIEVAYTITDAGGGPARTYRAVIRDYEAPERSYQSYLRQWSEGPPQPGGVGVPTRVPLSFDAELWARNSVQIARGRQMEFGYSATEVGIQRLIEGVLRFRSATQEGLTEVQRRDFIETARAVGERSKQDISQLSTDNSLKKKLLDDTTDRHSVFKALLENEISDINNISSEQASTELVQLQTQLRASYSAIARRAELSLVNFLR